MSGNLYMALFKTIRSVSLILLVCLCLPTQAQDFDWAPAFPVGSAIPLLEAPDQNGQLQTLGTLTGPKGLVLAFNRSFDWCPYCKAQLITLQDSKDTLASMGYTLATMTYDAVETLKLVEEDRGITLPMLHDEGIRHVNAYRILNTDYKPGDLAYGVPQPGIMVISPEGKILAKFAEENFRERPDLSDVLAVISRL